MREKPRRPFSLLAMDALRKVLPQRVYFRYVGRHEHGSMRLWRGIVAGLPTSASVLDIGAFRGEYALAARESRTDLLVHAFEPNPEQLPPLREAVAGRDIHVEPVALAEEAGQLSFALRGAASQLLDGSGASGGDAAAVTVRAVALDPWAKEEGVLPTLIKVDVEGGEAAIFRGGQETLERGRPIILCEVLTDAAGEAVAAAMPEGYLYFEINEDKGIKQADIPTRRLWRYCNWLLVPSERRSEIDVW